MTIFRDPKFVTATVDAVVLVGLYFVNKYAPGSVVEDVQTVVWAFQPLILAVLLNMIGAEVKGAIFMSASRRECCDKQDR